MTNLKTHMTNKLLLIILDGWGIGPKNEHNAINRAKTPYLDNLWRTYPHSGLKASGKAVGLLPGQIGSSEVGHMHLGAGRVIEQELTRLHKSMLNKSFYKNPAFTKAIQRAKKNNTALHLLGLLSDGGVHSHQKHLWALLKIAKDNGLRKVYIHVITDGRDTPPASAHTFIRELENKIKRLGVGSIATICGRYWAMDRDRNWHYTKKAVDLLTKGKGEKFSQALNAIETSHAKKIYDEFIEPTTIDSQGLIKNNDEIIFFNFRVDRMRQIVIALKKSLPKIHITTMTPYGVKIKNIAVAFDRFIPKNHLTEILSNNKIKQLKIAETQKYAHLTYFFNGTREKPYPLEDRIMVPSKKVITFDLAPKMSATEITQTILNNLNKYPVIIVNYANGDMVGHTGDIDAAILACKHVDLMLTKAVEEAKKFGYDVIITADHGNAEQMYDHKHSSRHTAHTNNPVPFILVTDKKIKLKSRGSLINVAPLILKMLKIPKPKEMGSSLIIRIAN